MIAQELPPADRQAILDLIARYGHSYDADDIEGLRALFQQDATLALHVEGAEVALHESNDATRWAHAMATKRAELASHGVQPRHFQTNTLVEPLGADQARATTIFVVFWHRRGEASPRPVHTGVYRDMFQRTAEGWRFTRREIRLDGRPAEVPES